MDRLMKETNQTDGDIEDLAVLVEQVRRLLEIFYQYSYSKAGNEKDLKLVKCYIQEFQPAVEVIFRIITEAEDLANQLLKVELAKGKET